MMTKKRTGDQKTGRRSPSSPKQPAWDDESSLDPRIQEHLPATARQLRLRHRREGMRAPAPLFQNDAPHPFTAAPPGDLHLVSTHRAKRNENPTSPRRRSKRRRPGPALPPATDRGTRPDSFFTSLYCSRGRRKRSRTLPSWVKRWVTW